MDVDGPRGAVVVHVGVEVHPRVQEHLQGGQAGLVDGEAFRRDHCVVDEPAQVHRPDGHAAHVGVAQHVVQVVACVAAGDDRLQKVEPPRHPRDVLGFVLQNEMGDLVGVQLLAGRELSGRASPDLPDDRSQMLADDDLAEPFVSEPERFQEIVVEEMAERAVPDVVDERGDAQQLFDVVGRRRVRDDLLQEGVEVPGEPAGDVHGAERVDEPAVFGGRVDPPGALELEDVA